ncbi:MAG: sensor domain CHASE-containing protein [Sphingobacteriales bacterium]|jgi:sensor domain CHASE-containing protein
MNAILHELHNKSTNIRNLGVAIGTKIEFVVPLEGNEKAKGLDYRSNSEQWPGVKKVIDSGEGLLVGP